MAVPYFPRSTDHFKLTKTNICITGAEPLSIDSGIMWQSHVMPRKSIDIRFTEYPIYKGKGLRHLSLLPARTGSGRARKWVKGLVPCGFLGQRPKPSESLSESISAIFKVLLSLFFSAPFFIDYLTLPFLSRNDVLK